MDPDRARELLARERTRIETALAAFERDGPLEASDREGAGCHWIRRSLPRRARRGSPGKLAALERAETRLAERTYGLSVESGQPIPDGRLEARPTAERTVEEEERFRRGA